MQYPQPIVIYEDNHLLAVNKPAGWLVQGDATGDLPLSEWAKGYIKDRYQKPGAVFLGVVHRLDRPVSGALLFARTSKALERMNRLFQERRVEKTYWAVTTEAPPLEEGSLVHYILKDKSRNVAKAFDQPSRRAAQAKKAELTYRLLGRVGTHYLLEVKPLTGRPHQIRVQLAKIGCPIRGDLKYGAPQPNEDASICLHCRALAFVHPVKKEPVRIVAAPPQTQIWQLFQPLLEES
ncbi:MAG: RluA family pseudouridine synthase [Bacteroidetes bacterium]|nr:MAG: RluA family pseudouridine synthase [Bacteroidota bacterium]